MAQFNKIQTLQAIIQTGMVPVYYNKEVEIAKQVVKACYEGGVRAFEFTNRGDFAHEVWRAGKIRRQRMSGISIGRRFYRRPGHSRLIHTARRKLRSRPVVQPGDSEDM